MMFYVKFLPWWRIPWSLATISLSQSCSLMRMILEDPREVAGRLDGEREGLDCKSPARPKVQSAGVSLLRVSWQLYLRAEMSGSASACDLEAVWTGSGSAIAHPTRSLSRPVRHSTRDLKKKYIPLDNYWRVSASMSGWSSEWRTSISTMMKCSGPYPR